MDPGSYDLNICRLKKFYEEVTSAWENWKEKPLDSDIRLGTLGEPTRHSEFLDILRVVKPTEYITDGRILGVQGDPRRKDVLDETIESKSGVILLWSNTLYYRRALYCLKESEIKVTIGISDSDLLKDIWEEEGEYTLIPGTKFKPNDLKDRKNVSIMEYRKNILLTDKKIIITKDIENLKPLYVYDRI